MYRNLDVGLFSSVFESGMRWKPAGGGGGRWGIEFGCVSGS